MPYFFHLSTLICQLFCNFPNICSCFYPIYHQILDKPLPIFSTKPKKTTESFAIYPYFIAFFDKSCYNKDMNKKMGKILSIFTLGLGICLSSVLGGSLLRAPFSLGELTVSAQSESASQSLSTADELISPTSYEQYLD